MAPRAYTLPLTHCNVHCPLAVVQPHLTHVSSPYPFILPYVCTHHWPYTFFIFTNPYSSHPALLLFSSPPFPTPPRPKHPSHAAPSSPPSYERLPVQARSPNQELSEGGGVEWQVVVVDRGLLQVEAAGGGCAVGDGLVLGLLHRAAHCGVGCIA